MSHRDISLPIITAALALMAGTAHGQTAPDCVTPYLHGRTTGSITMHGQGSGQPPGIDGLYVFDETLTVGFSIEEGYLGGGNDYFRFGVGQTHLVTKQFLDCCVIPPNNPGVHSHVSGTALGSFPIGSAYQVVLKLNGVDCSFELFFPTRVGPGITDDIQAYDFFVGGYHAENGVSLLGEGIIQGSLRPDGALTSGDVVEYGEPVVFGPVTLPWHTKWEWFHDPPISTVKRRFSDKDKADMAAVAADANIIAAAEAAAGVIPSVESPFILIESGLDWLFSAIVQRLSLDPADPSYTFIVPPVIPRYRPVAVRADLPLVMVDALNARTANRLQAVALMRAIGVAIDKAQGASDAGDLFWEEQQLKALSGFETQLAALLALQPALDQTFVTSWAVSGRPNVAISPQQAAAFIADLGAGTPLPVSVADALSSWGVDASAQVAIKDAAAALDPSRLVGDYPGDFLSRDVASKVTALGVSIAAAAMNNGVIVPCVMDVTARTQVSLGGFRRSRTTGRYAEVVTVRNRGITSIEGPIALAIDGLTASASVVNASGITSCALPSSPIVELVTLTGALQPDESVTVVLDFANTADSGVVFVPRVLAGAAAR